MVFTPKFEKFSNDARSYLDTGINDSVTSLVVGDEADFPSDGNFRILIGSELMLVTAVSGSTFTVVREIEGTTAASHSAGDSLRQILTAEALQQHIKDYAPFFGIKPLFNSLTDINGNNLTVSDFTWVNQDDAEAEDSEAGGIVMTIPRTSANASDLRILAKSAPSTPYHAIGIISHSSISYETEATDFAWASIGFRESSSGKLLSLSSVGGFKLIATRYTSPTVAASLVFEQDKYPKSPYMSFIRIGDDGTDLTLDYSNNGIDWTELYSENRGTHFDTAPDQLAFIGNGRWPSTVGSDTDHRAVLIHWSEE